MGANETKKNKLKQEKEVLISIARIKEAKGFKSEYQYNMEATYHIKNNLDHMEDIQEIDL